MLELLKEQLVDYLTEYRANKAECIRIMKERGNWQPLAERGAALKMLIEFTVREIKKYSA